MSQPKPSPAAAPPASADPVRRGVLYSLTAAVVGAAAGLLPVIPGAAFVLDPLLRKKKKDSSAGADDGFVSITSMAAVPVDGTPRAFPVIMDLQDAWNKFPKTEVGSVFLSKQPDGSLKCFNTSCPHLGCTINYLEKSKQFVCPCHASSFKLDGERNNLVPPRSMDPLAVEVRNGDEVWVKFETFRAGTADRKVVG
jgi:menaquinol-cytochrome c reductase iron-sulfur subunit